MTENEPIRAGELPISVRAPGKCILFGEHAVVHGGPELVVAIDLFVQIGARAGPRFALNGSPEPIQANPYLRESLQKMWSTGSPLDLSVSSRVPRSAGLGSSAAFCAGLTAVFGSLTGGIARPALAQRAFEIERGAQGVGSPGDTSASVAGGYVAINAGYGPNLWTISDGDRRWEVRRVRDPRWLWVVAYSGVPRNTAETVRAVGRRLAEPDGPDLLDRFRGVALSGIAALEAENREEVGRLLDENQRLLREVGVSHPRLEALLEAAKSASFGGKLTGAGAGGSIVALPIPGREAELVRRIARAGGVPFAVRVEPTGVAIVESPSASGERGRSLSSDDPDDGPGR